jgi:5'-nucleotidase
MSTRVAGEFSDTAGQGGDGLAGIFRHVSGKFNGPLQCIAHQRRGATMPCRIPERVARACLLVLFACAVPPAGADPVYKPLSLDIAHINDHHSNLAAHADFEIQVAGVPTRVEAGGLARIASLFKARQAQGGNLLKLHAGDATTGTLFHTLFKGEADAALMNQICFDAMGLGNHEFDDGDAGLRRFLDFLKQGGCATPVVNANVAPALGTPLAPRAQQDYLRPYVVRYFEGVPVGIVGVVVRGKTAESSRPLATTQLFDEADSAQRAIDALKQAGVRHIVVISHHGYAADLALAGKLTDVDVIVGGDSHTLLGDFAAQGLNAAGPYPTVAKNRDGAPVCIVQAWEYAKVFGLLNVRFDERGTVTQCAGGAILPVADRFKQADARGAFVEVDAARRAAILDWLAARPGVAHVAPDAEAAELVARYAGLMDALTRRVIGRIEEPLCLVRVPGEDTNRSGGLAGCERANRLARGSDAAQAVAEAFLAASKRADFALQNAGGVRTPIAAGPITIEGANKVLPFANVLVELPVSGAEMLATLEDAVATYLDAPGSNGAHPYAAGLRWDLDLSQPRGKRFANVEARDKASGAWAPLDPARVYTLVTNDFLGTGKEGYVTLGKIHASGKATNTYLLYTQTFIDYVQARGKLARPAPGEYSHKGVVTANGERL